MSKRRSSRRERFYSVIISALCMCAVVLAVAIAVDYKFSPAPDVQAQATEAPVADSTPEPLTLAIQLPPTQTPDAVLATPTPSPTPEPAPAYEFLPVIDRAETEEKIIAITIEDCSHLSYLKAAIQQAHAMGCKATLFPFGQSSMAEGMAEVLKVCIHELGWQVENRTWSNQMIFQMASADMAQEIWAADLAVDYALNMDYDMHLFRMRGGSGSVDARTHSYLKQLGYDAIVNWTVDAEHLEPEQLHSKLNPGYIYLFGSDKESLTKMLSLMEFALENGYRCVTLNELLGYPENACTEPEDSILSRTLPLPENLESVYVEHKMGDRAWQVLLIQSRLAELGYLDAEGADGIFGAGTSSAVSEFQAACGLLGTGVATAQTQELLFSQDAPAKR